MLEILTNHLPEQGIRNIPGLPISLLGLSQDGFSGKSVGELHEKLLATEPEFVAAHPAIAGLVDKAEVLKALGAFISQNQNFDVLVTTLVSQLTLVEAAPIITPPITVAAGFRGDVLLGGPHGLLKLPNKKGVDKIEVIDIENPEIAEVVTTEEISAESGSLYYLFIHGLRPGKTQVLLRTIAGDLSHALLTEVRVIGGTEVSQNSALMKALSNHTTLPMTEQKDIAAILPQNQVKKLIANIQSLARGEARSCHRLFQTIDISPYYLNLIVLNIPNLGPELSLEVIQRCLALAMDKRDFDDDKRRMKNYGVLNTPVAESGFSLAAAWSANRNVAQSLGKYLTPAHAAQLVGVDLQTFLDSQHPTITEIRALLSQLPRTPVGK